MEWCYQYIYPPSFWLHICSEMQHCPPFMYERPTFCSAAQLIYPMTENSFYCNTTKLQKKHRSTDQQDLFFFLTPPSLILPSFNPPRTPTRVTHWPDLKWSSCCWYVETSRFLNLEVFWVGNIFSPPFTVIFNITWFMELFDRWENFVRRLWLWPAFSLLWVVCYVSDFLFSVCIMHNPSRSIQNGISKGQSFK